MTKACCGILGLRPGEEPCRFWGMDMDMDPYCVHPAALQASPSFGLYTRAMSLEGHCRSPDYALWEKDNSCRTCRGYSPWVSDCETCNGTGLHSDEAS